LCKLVTVVFTAIIVLAGLVLYEEHERSRVRESTAMKALVQELNNLKKEKDDLSQLLLHKESRDSLTDIMERAKAFEKFVEDNGLLVNANNTKTVRECIAKVFVAYNIQSMFDFPCGDGSWQKYIEGIDGVHYVGGDLNVPLLKQAEEDPVNKELGFEYRMFDGLHFPLRRSFDLVMFRDVIEQQRIYDSLKTLQNFVKSNSTYVLITFWPAADLRMNERGVDLADAGWFTPNLELPPFGFPEPIGTCENDDPGSLHHGQQILGLWRLKDLAPRIEAAMATLNKPKVYRRPDPPPEKRMELKTVPVDLRDFFFAPRPGGGGGRGPQFIDPVFGPIGGRHQRMHGSLDELINEIFRNPRR
jgi:hypothetical protein